MDFKTKHRNLEVILTEVILMKKLVLIGCFAIAGSFFQASAMEEWKQVATDAAASLLSNDAVQQGAQAFLSRPDVQEKTADLLKQAEKRVERAVGKEAVAGAKKIVVGAVTQAVQNSIKATLKKWAWRGLYCAVAIGACAFAYYYGSDIAATQRAATANAYYNGSEQAAKAAAAKAAALAKAAAEAAAAKAAALAQATEKCRLAYNNLSFFSRDYWTKTKDAYTAACIAK